MEKKIIVLVTLVVAVIIAAAAVFVITNTDDDDSNDTVDPVGPAPEEPTTITCKDMSGKTVVLPKNIESVFLAGSGTVRHFCHLGLIDLVCGSDSTTGGVKYGGNTYMYAFDDKFANPDLIKNSVKRSVFDLEKLLTCNNGEKPQVLVVLDTLAADNASTVESLKKAGVAVFEVWAIVTPVDLDGNMNPDYIKQLRCLGEAFGVEKRANDIIEFYTEQLKEIKAMGQKGGDAYMGGLTIIRDSGINHTSMNYPPFILTGMRNIAYDFKDASISVWGGTLLKPEELINVINNAGDFDMFIEIGAWKNKKNLPNSDIIIAAALANHGVDKGMVVLPMNGNGCEYDSVLANSYMVAGYINGVDPAIIREKVDAVYEFYYGDRATDSDGKKLFDRMCDQFEQMAHCRFGEFVTFTTNGIIMTDGTLMTSA